MTRQLRRATRRDVQIASRPKCQSEHQGCCSCRGGGQHAQPCSGTSMYVTSVPGLCCACSSVVWRAVLPPCLPHEDAFCSGSFFSGGGAPPEFSGTLSWRKRTPNKYPFIERAVLAARSGDWMHDFVPLLDPPRSFGIKRHSTSGHIDGNGMLCH